MGNGQWALGIGEWGMGETGGGWGKEGVVTVELVHEQDRLCACVAESVAGRVGGVRGGLCRGRIWGGAGWVRVCEGDVADGGGWGWCVRGGV